MMYYLKQLQRLLQLDDRWMSSVREIARLAGVSVSTVSRALNNNPAVREATRERVLSVANDAGYVAAVGRRSTDQIGLVYAGSETLGSTFDSALLCGLVGGVNEARFDVVILNMHRDKAADETYSQYFMRKGIRGVVVRSTSLSRHVCEAIAAEAFPMIVVGERFDDGLVSYIDCESREESRRAVEYLIGLGHERVALAMNTVPDSDHLDRLSGYEDALKEHGLSVDPRLILRHQADFAGGASALHMGMSMKPRPPALYLADPMLAVGAFNAAHEHGIRIPQDISIIGFDDAETRFSVYPTMTAVCQDARDLGTQAAAELLRKINGNFASSVQRQLPTFFEVNRSTAPPFEVH